jgi:hypothetical protein
MSEQLDQARCAILNSGGARPEHTIHSVQTEYVKAAVITAWVLVVGTLGLAFGITSITGWAVLAVLSVIPPTVMLRLWHAPVPSMSETIRDVLR